MTYNSAPLGTYRRMHVYTPPGYESGRGRYPVFYLLHGAGDNDDSWSSVGRAGFILDNLIAAKRATPMIVVMPAGHLHRGGPVVRDWGERRRRSSWVDFTTAVMPYVEPALSSAHRPCEHGHRRTVDGRRPDAERCHTEA